MKEELKEVGKEVLIETVRVIGYTLVLILIAAINNGLDSNKS